jgi:hypothetical protein
MRLGLAAAAARVLRAVALAGVVLPDAEAERFLHVPALLATLLLADLDGATAVAPAAAATSHADHALALARRLLPPGSVTNLPATSATALERVLDPGATAPALETLIATLDDATVHATYE